MLKNYFISSLRALLKNKLHAAINIIGLSLALGICLLIVQHLFIEFSYDNFHSSRDHIYRITMHEEWDNGQVLHSPVSSFILGETLQEAYPNEIETVQFLTQNAMVRNKDGESFMQPIALGSSNFLEVFDFDLGSSDSESVLKELNSVVITHDIATKFFGRTDVLGEVLELRIGEQFELYKITGLIPEIPNNSSLQFQVLVPMENAHKILSEDTFDAWLFALIENYVRIDPAWSVEQMNEQFNATISSIISEQEDEVELTVWLQPLLDVHLNMEFQGGVARVSDPSMLYILGGVALLILIIACINFTTMAIGNASARGHEVGIRKSIGAGKKQLILQYMTEALVLTSISVIVGILLSQLGVNYFNQLFNTEITMDLSFQIIGVILLMILIVSFAAGFYPSLVIANLNPVKMLKGQPNISGKSSLRKILVSVQFIMSLMLIAATLIMQKQMNFLHDKDLGFQKDLLVIADLNSPSTPGLLTLIDTGMYKANLLQTELKQYPSIAAGATSQTVGDGVWMELGYEDEDGKSQKFKFNIITEYYLNAMDITLVEGENFRTGSTEFNRKSLIVNETFVKEFGLINPLGKTIPGGRFENLQIIGVVEDFHFESLFQKVGPLVLATSGDEIFPNINNLMMDTDPAPDMVFPLQYATFERDLEKIAKVWERIFPGEDFAYEYLDQRLAEQYRTENNLSRMVSSSAVVAIFIATLGLFALTMLILSGRGKEIGIRKVLGASVSSITILLTREFLILLIISFVISVPISYYLMKEWLLRFEYQTAIGPLVFLLSGSIGLIFTLLTVSSQAIKASLQNPVNSIREE